MPIFHYRAGTKDGQIIKARKEAESEIKLRQELEQKGLYIFSIKRKGKGWRKRIKAADVLLFINELSVLLKAGLTMLNSLDILTERVSNESFKYIISEVKKDVEGGMSLSDALSVYPDIFSSVFIASLKVGETSGNLVNILDRQAAYLKKILSLKRTVTAALIYPAILLTISLAVVIILLYFVVPTFSGLYEDFHRELPKATVVLISVSHFIKKYFIFLLLVIIAFWNGAVTWYRSEKGRLFVDRYQLKIPLVGNILSKYYLSQLTKMLSTILRGGIPLINSLKVAAATLENKYLTHCLKNIIPKVEAGTSLASAMRDIELIPSMTIEMIAVGEATGSLEDMLENVSNFYDEEIDMAIISFNAFIEPILILTMGLLVGAIVIIMYLPIFQVASGF